MNEASVSHSLIKILLERESYYKYINFIKKHVLDESVRTVVEDLDYYYCDHDEIDLVNIDDFGVWFHNVRHSSYSDDLLECYNILFEKIKKAKAETADKLIQFLNLQALRAEVEKALVEDGNVQDVIDICEKYLKQATLSSKYEEFLHDVDEDEEDDDYTERQIPWRLNCLNESIGKIGPGDFGIVFAGTNAGKTSFLCSEISNMMQHISGKVLWLYNEGFFTKLKYRFWSSCLELTNAEILEDLPAAKEKYRQYCGGDINKVRFCNATNMSIYDVENLVREMKPSLVVIDQLDNLAGFDKSQRDDIRALKLFQRCRSIAINNQCPIIVADQATNTEGDKQGGGRWYKRFLTKEQLQGSRLAKQSTAEFMIGIGYDGNEPDTRYITTPKVKSLEGSNDNEMQREAWFKRAIARFED